MAASIKKAKERKYFFFEKKKQKTFDYIEPGGAQGQAEAFGAPLLLLKRR
jgi:hypothetical protein